MMEDLTLRKAIQLAVTLEQMGADFYNRMERKFSADPNIKEIFSRLAKDEQAHEVQFKEILSRTPEESIAQQQYELFQFLRATAISDIFRQDTFRKTDQIKNGNDALGFALAFEKATLQYYQAIREILEDSPHLDSIIDAERKHVVALMRVIMADARFRSLDDPW